MNWTYLAQKRHQCGGSTEHGNELFRFIKAFEQLNEYQVLKMDYFHGVSLLCSKVVPVTTRRRIGGVDV
jgi:hypothetical protein